jgi:hypothetical protein
VSIFFVETRIRKRTNGNSIACVPQNSLHHHDGFFDFGPTKHDVWDKQNSMPCEKLEETRGITQTIKARRILQWRIAAD